MCLFAAPVTFIQAKKLTNLFVMLRDDIPDAVFQRSKILSCVVSLFSSAYSTYWPLFFKDTPLQTPVRRSDHSTASCAYNSLRFSDVSGLYNIFVYTSAII